jgi:hypothetical protein
LCFAFSLYFWSCEFVFYIYFWLHILCCIFCVFCFLSLFSVLRVCFLIYFWCFFCFFVFFLGSCKFFVCIYSTSVLGFQFVGSLHWFKDLMLQMSLVERSWSCLKVS